MKFEDGEITFRKDIREAIFTDDAIVVCLAVSTDEMDNENVIGVDTSGDRLWEIEPVVPTSERDAPFMNLVERDGAL
ncbi:hypothetical protein [Haloarchaeobius litoreus]|uniref:Uncharacterized protein n=1 Tax=Haloarchaeobius litoreus TaxID=755306 RepID=A0ABD6DIC9_9EURY|nr:hypothetical protein [Haloarchaeobius litoreus]